MQIDPTAVANASKAGQSLSGLADSFDTFLTLLTEQLKNQDPLEPLDSSEFTSQLVQFTQVEQSISSNQNLERLINLQTASNLSNLVGYLGKSVEVATAGGVLSDGQATWHYDFGTSNPNLVSITVQDETGKAVYSTLGDADPGKQDFVWDGLDNAGNQLGDGVYAVIITGVTLEGEALEPQVSSTATVTAVETIGSNPMLTLSDMRVSADAVLSVSNQND